MDDWLIGWLNDRKTSESDDLDRLIKNFEDCLQYSLYVGYQ